MAGIITIIIITTGRALMSALSQAIAPNPYTNLLNVYIQIANKMGFQQKEEKKSLFWVSW
jgi:hypothetical protein